MGFKDIIEKYHNVEQYMAKIPQWFDIFLNKEYTLLEIAPNEGCTLACNGEQHEGGSC